MGSIDPVHHRPMVPDVGQDFHKSVKEIRKEFVSQQKNGQNFIQIIKNFFAELTNSTKLHITDTKKTVSHLADLYIMTEGTRDKASSEQFIEDAKKIFTNKNTMFSSNNKIQQREYSNFIKDLEWEVNFRLDSFHARKNWADGGYDLHSLTTEAVTQAREWKGGGTPQPISSSQPSPSPGPIDEPNSVNVPEPSPTPVSTEGEPSTDDTFYDDVQEPSREIYMVELSETRVMDEDGLYPPPEGDD